MTYVILVCSAIICIILLYITNKNKKTKIKEFELNQLIIELKSQKRGLETKYGYAIENLSPQLKELKDYNPKSFRQMGQPIDYLYYGPDGVEFIEIKTGVSKLSKTQRTIRDQINSGKVSFKVVRIKN